MIDRNDLDLRIATHRARTAMIDARAWQRQQQLQAPLFRTGLARALVALAGWLAPAGTDDGAVGSVRRSASTAR